MEKKDFIYVQKMKTANGEVDVTKGIPYDNVLDFAFATEKVSEEEEITYLTIRLKAKETQYVYRELETNGKKEVKQVKDEVFVTHLIENKEDVERFISWRS